ncbi:MAG: right-handed parallel beta-helix repeat-containing protein [Fidelibacterota bacterium]|nr:MAG: right-handed parallel beta-helix repeat-containing protein [Candidatus Neomarinimicrobiota bacterium]
MIYSRVAALVLLISPLLSADTTYVAVDGDDAGPGTLDQPYSTLTRAVQGVAPGDVIFMRGGLYACDGTIYISKSGKADSLITIAAYPGEVPVLDFEAGGTGSTARGIALDSNYWHLRGLVIQRAGDNGLYVSGEHNLVERVTTRYNQDSGLQLHTGAAFNRVVRCDSYLNYDPANHGENADGFAAKFDLGPGNEFVECRAWNNSDDGWDFWNAGNGVSVTDCWAFRNGVDIWGEGEFFQGDGNGFKLGKGAGAHTLIRCLAFDLPHHGIDVNGNQTGVEVFNSTCYRNQGRNFYFDEDTSSHVLRNNLSYDAHVNIYPNIDDAYNSWNGFAVTAADFVSLDTTGVSGPREADGRLPQLDFLHLAVGSSLIDAGIDVGQPFEGPAPDLGYVEYSSPTAIAADTPPAPLRFTLYPNYPNPFNPATTISYHLPARADITLRVYDLRGREIATLVAGNRPAGTHTVNWHGRDHHGLPVPSGVYVARLEMVGSSAVVRMLLLK